MFFLEIFLKSAAHLSESLQFRLAHLLVMIGQKAIAPNCIKKSVQRLLLVVFVKGSLANDCSSEQPEVFPLLPKCFPCQSLHRTETGEPP